MVWISTTIFSLPVLLQLIIMMLLLTKQEGFLVIPPDNIRQLRDLVRYNKRLTNFTVGEKNRAQNCLIVSNIKVDEVFSKAAKAITERLLENNKSFDVTLYLIKNIKDSVEKIQSAVDGTICAEQAEKLRIIRSHMDNPDLCKANLESTILSLAEKYLPLLNLVLTVTDIKELSAIAVIAEICVDMTVFPTSKHFCAWTGFAPQNNESADKKKITRISRAGAYIKPLLVQCAKVAVKNNKHPDVKNRYPALKSVKLINRLLLPLQE